jgi:RimJ/RimL family protein N-acetyltransferase
MVTNYPVFLLLHAILREHMNEQATIRPAARLVGHKLVLRDVQPSDAAYILSLRLDPGKSAYLSAVDADAAKQVAWIEGYRQGSGQAYFIICLKDAQGGAGEPVGTVRLYNARGSSFSWGSWIVADGAPPHVAIESAVMVYRYALDHLGFRDAHFEVDQGNRSVWHFHERFGARRVAEDDVEYRYALDHDAIQAALRRYARFLPDPVIVQA